ncbi:hypothetical protein MKW92_025081 [Papaver armeniacum]|nr:hypothetical protein MKW92_025081 [Papaver armeniacum]
MQKILDGLSETQAKSASKKLYFNTTPIPDSKGRALAAATTSFRGNVSSIASFYGRVNSGSASTGWISGAIAFLLQFCTYLAYIHPNCNPDIYSIMFLDPPAYMLQEQEAHAAELERTFIAIKPDGVQRELISEIVARSERKGFKLVAIKLVVPSKDFAQKYYHDLKERPFLNGLCGFLSSGPVWEGLKVPICYFILLTSSSLSLSILYCCLPVTSKDEK